MKKIMILMIILSIVFIGTLPAQGLGYGVTGGANMSKLVGDFIDDLDGDSKFINGLAIGGFVTLPVGPVEGRVEALFSQNGGKIEVKEGGYEVSLKWKQNTLSVPVLVGLNVIPQLRVFAGPYFDFFLSGKIITEISSDGFSMEEEEDIESEDITTLAMGIVFGAAYAVMQNLEIEVRMARGLNTLDATDDDDDLKPSVLSARVNFYLKK